MLRTIPGAIAACLVWCAAATPSARADAIIVPRAMKASTIAEVYIEEDHVRVDLEIGVEDLAAFGDLLPEELLEGLGLDAPPLEERLPRFFSQGFTVRAGDGPPLPGLVRDMEGRERTERDEITGEPLDAGNDRVEAVVFASLVYPFEGRPATLSFKPPAADASGRAAANIGFMTYDHGLPVMDFRYLGREETVRLDWDDPWYSQFENRNLWRAYREPVSVFLYVEPYEVRAEVIVRPFDLQHWVDLGLDGRTNIPADMQSVLKQDAAAFVADQLDLTIDGRAFRPEPERVNFLRRTLRSSTVIDPAEDLDVHSATLGVIFVQPMTGLPQQASVRWDLFSPKMDRIRAAATDEAGPLPYYLTPGDTVLTWKNFLKNPTVPSLVEVAAPPRGRPAVARALPWVGVVIVLVGLARRAAQRSLRRHSLALATAAIVVLAAAGIQGLRGPGVTSPQAEAVLLPLLRNVYHAFDFRDEEQVYDTLAHSIVGDLLTSVYLETRKGLELASQGGARVKVKQVELLNVEPEALRGERGFTATCTWNVTGSVGHWGHVHQRTNQYRAELKVEPVEGHWKLTEVTVLEEQRVL